MNINDAYAPVMSQMFSGKGDQPAYKVDYRNQRNGLIYERNRSDAAGGKISEKMDFSRPDAAPAAQLNRVLWQDQKGMRPCRRRSIASCRRMEMTRADSLTLVIPSEDAVRESEWHRSRRTPRRSRLARASQGILTAGRLVRMPCEVHLYWERGVLRLGGCCASRSIHFAQDDKVEETHYFRCAAGTIARFLLTNRAGVRPCEDRC